MPKNVLQSVGGLHNPHVFNKNVQIIAPTNKGDKLYEMQTTFPNIILCSRYLKTRVRSKFADHPNKCPFKYTLGLNLDFFLFFVVLQHILLSRVNRYCEFSSSFKSNPICRRLIKKCSLGRSVKKKKIFF